MMSSVWTKLFQILVVLALSDGVRAAYEHNSFLQSGVNVPKDLNQYNLAIIIPPGKEPYLTRPGENPPGPPVPGYVWVQIPLSNTSINGVNKPPKENLLPPSTVSSSTKEPTFTIEFPGIPDEDDLKSRCLRPRGQFPSTTCDKYVDCWDGSAVERSCPAGFLFNPLKLYCDYPHNVDCGGKPSINTPTTTPPSVSVDVIFSSGTTPTVMSSSQDGIVGPSLRKLCLKSTGLFPGTTCGKFVNCWNNFAVEQDCPEGLHFSSEGYCDYPQNVDCGGQNNRKQTSEGAKNHECPMEFGIFRDKSDCSQYYTCAYYKVAAKYSCPEGLTFSDSLGICDYSYRVDCTKEPQIFQRKSPTNILDNHLAHNAFAHPDLLKPSEVGDRRCTVSQGIVRDKDNCASYHVCESGNVVASYVCPRGYQFSSELGACETSEKVNCGGPPKAYTFSGTPLLPQEMQLEAAKCVPGSVFRLNPECTSACRCRKDVAEIIRCSAGLAYDSLLDKCVPAHMARC